MNHLAITPEPDLYAQQAALELDMTDRGVDRYKAYAAKAADYAVEDYTAYGSRLLAKFQPVLEEAIVAYMRERESGKAGRKGEVYTKLKEVQNPRLVAYLAVKKVLATLSYKNRMSDVANSIGGAIADEVRYRKLREEDRKLYDRIHLEAKTKSSYNVRRKVANRRIDQNDINIPDWSNKAKLLIGCWLLELVIAHTGLVERRFIIRRGNDNVVFIVPTAATLAYVSSRTEAIALLNPDYSPMVVPPTRWKSAYGGGYLTKGVKPYTLIKTRSKPILAAMSPEKAPLVFEAINRAQEVAWRVNPFILSVLETMWDRDYSLADIPPRFDPEIPPKPHDIETNEDARRDWRAVAYSTHEAIRAISTSRVLFMHTLATAHRYSAFDRIYMPYQYDFRGRIYAVPSLNPQGPDWMKGVLQFAEGKPLTEESAVWLAIHLANSGDFKIAPKLKASKAPLGDRVAWVYENEETILATANDPFADWWWTEADKPFQFLAACKEWAGWREQGEGFVSHLPIALDGSCSGTQHFSMALRDEVGGAAVNLIPCDEASDIYTLVLDKTVEALKCLAAGDDEDATVAAQWLSSNFLIRDTFKRPVMTFSYGSKRFGFREQISVDTLMPAYRAHTAALRGGRASTWPFEGSGYKASLLLSKLIFEAVTEIVKAAALAMEWLTDTATVVASAGIPVRWGTPDGFRIEQSYRDQKSKRLNTMINGYYIQVRTREEREDAPIAKRKQATTFPPNYVHSLDGTHLRLTVVRAAEEGINSIALVHDSFGTHAADTPRFFQLLRETMVEMYRDRDVLGDLRRELSEQVDDEVAGKIKEPPAMGTLDLQGVLESDYAFA